MWSGFWLAMFAVAAIATYLWIFRKDEAVIATSAIASVTWFFLAVTGSSIEVVTDGTTETASAGAGQYFLLGFGLVSLIIFILAIFGWYPDKDEIGDKADHYHT